MEPKLENIQKRFSVARLEEGDIRSRSDNYKQLKQLILAHEPMYPEIAKWFQDKVSPGVCSSERVAFVGYLDEKPAVSAIVKRGKKAKFCHLHINEGLRDAHLGDTFFSLMAYEVRDLAQSVYFTLPENVWDSKKEFFRSFNFSHFQKANIQYRLFEEELECAAPFNEVWDAVSAKLPKICDSYAWGENSLTNDLLISIHPNYVEQIFAGKKRYEIRRKFSTKWLGHRINIYATEPAMHLAGHATVRSVLRNSPKGIWKKLGPELGCSQIEFERYTNNAQEVFAIELGDVTPFRVPILRNEIVGILKESLIPPQSYSVLKPNKPWGQAISLANLLQGTFRGQILSSLNKIFSTPHSMLSKGSTTADFQLRRLLF